MSFLNLTVTFWILSALSLAGLWLADGYARHRRLWVCRRLSGAERAPEGHMEVSCVKRRLRSTVFLVGVVLALAALARPWWGKRLIPYPARSRDVLVVFDCSRSMLADDVAPSRLEHGKWLTRKLLERFPGDRFGLVAFVGDAFLECPLTPDRSSFYALLDELDMRTIPLGGTNLNRALEVADEAFAGAEGVDRAVVLLTDGDELQGDSLAFAGTLREKNIPVLVIGLGNPSQGALIRDETGHFIRDENEKLVTTKLAEERLKQLARETRGVYARSTTVAPNLDPVIQRIATLVPAEREEQVKTREIERYQIPLALSVACFLVFLCVGEKKTRVVAVAALMVIAAGFPARGDVVSAAPVGGGADEPDARMAAERIDQAEGEEKARLYQNLGVQYQHEGDLKKAEEAYEQAVFYGREGGAAATAAQWNLGVVRHEMARDMMRENPQESLHRLTAAEASYREALRWTENQSDLGKNQEVLLKDREQAEAMKKEQEKQQQNNENNGEDQPKPQDQQGDQGGQENGQSADNPPENSREPGDDPLENPQPGDGPRNDASQQSADRVEEGAFDEKQAAAVLADMREKEKDLREALKENRLRNMKNRPVEKNW
ncbi:MAG: VWA domain-containing protein [Lentisphaeria bacterium]|nr:VWA domain-containing protein [Lentisphaeria bacterium]